MTVAYQAVGLTTAEIDILAKAQKKRDYYYRSVKGRRLFQLGLGPAALAFVGASSETDQRFLDVMIASRPASEYASAILERRGVTWAVEALRRESERSPAVAVSDTASDADTVVLPVGAPAAPTGLTPDAGNDFASAETVFDANLLPDDAVTIPRIVATPTAPPPLPPPRLPLARRPAP